MPRTGDTAISSLLYLGGQGFLEGNGRAKEGRLHALIRDGHGGDGRLEPGEGGVEVEQRQLLLLCLGHAT